MRTLPLALCLALASGRAAAAPLTLDEALAAAARSNADLLQARASRDSAEVDLLQSWSGVLPRLDLTGASGKQFQGEQKFVTSFPDLADPTQWHPQTVTVSSASYGAHELRLTLRWTLFDGLSTWRRVGGAREALRASDRQLDETTLQVAFEVTRRFYEVVKQERSLALREEAASRSEELVRRADALFQAGRGSKADTFAARVNLGTDRIAVESQRDALARARADLAALLGLSAGIELEVVAPAAVATPGLPTGEPPALPELLERARRARPLLAARGAQVAAADEQISQARGGYWPVLGVQGSYARQGPDLFGQSGVLGDPSRQYQGLAQVTLAWNLFQGRETLAAEQRAEVQARRARVDAAQAAWNVAAEVARARSSVVALARAAAIAQDSQVAAEQGLSLARERLEAGAATQLEVRDATVKLAEAKLTLVSTLVDHAVARADLNRAVGGTL